MPSYITPAKLREKGFQELIKDYLVEENGYIESFNTNYDNHYAIDKEMLFEFLQKTQADELEELKEIYGPANYKQKIIQNLNKNLARKSMIDVIKNGIKDYGVKLKLAYFKPPTNFNRELNRLYEENILSVIEELNYKDDKRIDLVIFLNGLPIIAFELKNPNTGQNYKRAINQFKHQRDPADKLFKFKQRVIVSFAVDTNEAYMTTSLNGENTFFLPFNKGKDGGAGNPSVPGKLKTHYIWEDILKKDSIMEIIDKFIFVDIEEETDEKGNIKRKETLIFPRYHQLDSVRKTVADAKEKGSGHKYLIQHSAGSGKTYSITWLAHRLSKLHDSSNQKIFDAAIVVTDRLVLDRQLQNAITNKGEVAGTIATIDKDSAQLADHINRGTKIIVSTIQKFPYILDEVSGTRDKNYAIIIDEAHSGSSGRNMLALRETLSFEDIEEDMEKALEEAAELDRQAENNAKDIEDKINEELQRIQNVQSVSFFAFTATPKKSTLNLFGRPNSKGEYVPFHLYSMRQAIEEGFILDVLQNYTTYKMYYRVNKKVEDDPEIKSSQGSREIAKYVSLHPHNISQKTEVIIEHFRNNTMHKIGGQAKAMLVTSSRLHAVRYKLEFDRYIKEKGYTDLGTLVAFSGTVKDKGIDYTENTMNDLKSSIKNEFDKDEYQVLIVANKFQTGFDQPKLHTMYVDKRLRGLNAVQTLSRLNRVCSGKEDTFILDFVNAPEDIQSAFEPYYENTRLEEGVDPNEIYSLYDEILESRLINLADVEEFVEMFYAKEDDPTNTPAMNNLLEKTMDRLEERPEEEQREFRDKLKTYINLYTFILQIAPIQDEDLHMMNIYLRFLLKRLDIETTGTLDISDKVVLEYYKLDNKGEQDIGLVAEESLGTIDTKASSRQEEEREPLSEIIKRLNERFQTDFSENERISIEQIKNTLTSNDNLKVKAENNPIDDFRLSMESEFEEAVIESFDQNQQFYGKILRDEEFRNELVKLLLIETYNELRGKKARR